MLVNENLQLLSNGIKKFVMCLEIFCLCIFLQF